MLLGLAHDLVAADAGFLGQPAAVGLRVGDVAVGGALGAGQYPHSMDVRVVLAEQDRRRCRLLAEDPAAQPLYFLPQRGALVHEPDHLGVHVGQERPHGLFLVAVPAPSGQRESRLPARGQESAAAARRTRHPLSWLTPAEILDVYLA